MGIGKALLLVPLVLGLNGCLGLWALDTVLPEDDEPEQVVEAVAEPEVEAVGEKKDNSFGEAVNSATAAAEAAQTAKTPEEWESVASLWAQAAELMKAVPSDSENYQTAQEKSGEYQANLEYAKGNASAAQPDDEPKGFSKVEISVAAMQAYLLSQDPDREIFVGADIIGDDDHHLGIAVQPVWNLADRQTKELFLTEMGKAWQESRSPSNPNKAMLFVVDIQNNEILGRYDAGGPHLMD